MDLRTRRPGIQAGAPDLTSGTGAEATPGSRASASPARRGIESRESGPAYEGPGRLARTSGPRPADAVPHRCRGSAPCEDGRGRPPPRTRTRRRPASPCRDVVQHECVAHTEDRRHLCDPYGRGTPHLGPYDGSAQKLLTPLCHAQPHSCHACSGPGPGPLCARPVTWSAQGRRGERGRGPRRFGGRHRHRAGPRTAHAERPHD